MSGAQYVTYGLGSQPYGNVPATALDQNFADATNYPNSTAPIRSLANKAADIISVKDAGALGNGVFDDTVAIQTAINSLPSTGGGIYLPQSASAYNLTQTLNVTLGGTAIYGPANGSVFMNQLTHNADFITVQAGNCEIRGVGFKAGAYGASQKWCINASSSLSSGLVVADVRASFCHSFLTFGGATTMYVNNINVTNLQVATGVGILINNANATSSISQAFFGNAVGNQALAGIQILASAVTQLDNCDLFKMGNALYLLPNAAATVGATFCNNCFFDTSTNGAVLDGSAAGSQVSTAEFCECWFNSNTSYGARLRGTVKGVGFNQCQFGLNGVDGLFLESSTVQDVIVSACKAFGNTGVGIDVGANVSLFKLLGNTCGPYSGVGGNGSWGILVQAGTGNNYQIVDNDCRGNTTGAISNSATGTTAMVLNNPGNSASQTAGITVTASPFTYTAGASPETVYLNTGTVSLVSVEGVGVFSQTNCTVRLRPKQSVVVTYTVAPGMAKTIEG